MRTYTNRIFDINILIHQQWVNYSYMCHFPHYIIVIFRNIYNLFVVILENNNNRLNIIIVVCYRFRENYNSANF